MGAPYSAGDVNQVLRAEPMIPVYEPRPAYTPWYRRRLAWAGGITPAGLIIAGLVIAPSVVLGGVLLAWEAYAVVYPCVGYCGQ